MMVKWLREWKELWDDPRGPGKLLIIVTVVVTVLFFKLVILMVSGGR